jgi:urease accessory protein
VLTIESEPHIHTHSHDLFGAELFTDARAPGIARIGIGGPVGSGKTALIEALVPRLLAIGHRPLVVTNDIFTREDAEHVRATLADVLPAERVVGVETGSCPHTAVRDDPSMNLDAVAELTDRFPDADLVLVESGGDNLTLTFSSALADYFIFVIDVARGGQDPPQARSRCDQLRPPGDQQDRPGPPCPRELGRDGARRSGGSR